MASRRSTESPPALQIVNSYWSESDDDEEAVASPEEPVRCTPAADQCHANVNDSHETDLPPQPEKPSHQPSDSSDESDGNHDAHGPKSTVTARGKYAIGLRALPNPTQELILHVSKFFTENINLQRRAAAISKTTMNKAKERILCKY